ncbi:MAG: glycosyltransferase [Eubacterium sp.]|nr:glycosyltransferase [Eubacterium sp.]
MSPLISVIIPVYKVEKYIRKCLGSVINQTYKNLEIILVDDGSPDNCGNICDEYAFLDKRIIVVHKENGGLSDARNAAIDIAKGEFITFVDSDDWISENMIELLYNDIVKNDSDISVTNPVYYFENTGLEKKGKFNKQKFCGSFSVEEALNGMFSAKIFDVTAWAKLYKASLFNGIRYPKGLINEDEDVTYKLIFFSKSVSVIEEELYYYLQRGESIMGVDFAPNRTDAVFILENMVKFIKLNIPACLSAARERFFMICVYLVTMIPFTKFKNEKKFIFENIKKIRTDVLNDPNVSINRKILCFISYFGTWAVKLSMGLRKALKS